jgi:hypothetical protein
MCKEVPVILVNKAVDPKRIIGKKWRAEEEERHKGLLTRKKNILCLPSDASSVPPWSGVLPPRKRSKV